MNPQMVTITREDVETSFAARKQPTWIRACDCVVATAAARITGIKWLYDGRHQLVPVDDESVPVHDAIEGFYRYNPGNGAAIAATIFDELTDFDNLQERDVDELVEALAGRTFLAPARDREAYAAWLRCKPEIRKAAKAFPPTFRVRAWKGEYYIDLDDSFLNDRGPSLVLRRVGDEVQVFGRCTPAELQREIVAERAV
jgi:hypothetical protein